MAESTEEQGISIVIDGKPVTWDDLTFAEQRKVRTYVRQLADDEALHPLNADMEDFLPAFVAVVKQRDDANYSVDEACELRPGDVIQEKKPERPTKATRSTGGRSGTRATSSTSA